MISHTQHYVRVGAQRYRYSCVSQEFLDELRMHAFQERGERALTKIGGVDRVACLRSEDEARCLPGMRALDAVWSGFERMGS